MRHYGGPTPKRHCAWSNSPGIASLDLGRLVGWTKKLRQREAEGTGPAKTVVKYHDKQGKLRWKGTKALKPTESETYLLVLSCFWKCIVTPYVVLVSWLNIWFIPLVLYNLSCTDYVITILGCSTACLPRNYPAAFGAKLVSIFQDLITRKSGMPELPKDVYQVVRIHFHKWSFLTFGKMLKWHPHVGGCEGVKI